MDSTIKGILFDMDGTLLDTLSDISAAVNEARTAAGLPPKTKEEHRRCIGNGQRYLLEASFGRVMSEPEYARIGKIYHDAYDRDLTVRTLPYEGVPELLKTASAAGLKLAVLSNKENGQVVRLQEALLPDIAFDFVLGQTERFPLKPDPASSLWIAEQMGLRPEEMAFVGDSYQDILTATNAGMHGWSALWGYQDREKILTGGTPERFFASPQELTRYLLQK